MDNTTLASELLKNLESFIREVAKEEISNAGQPSIKKCKGGPIIQKITILSKRLVRINFYGEDIFTAIVTISDEDGNMLNKVNSNGVAETIALVNDQPEFALTSDLKNRTYIAVFQAVSCQGASTYKFNGKTGDLVSDNPVESCCKLQIEDIKVI